MPVFERRQKIQQNGQRLGKVSALISILTKLCGQPSQLNYYMGGLFNRLMGSQQTTEYVGGKTFFFSDSQVLSFDDLFVTSLRVLSQTIHFLQFVNEFKFNNSFPQSEKEAVKDQSTSPPCYL